MSIVAQMTSLAGCPQIIIVAILRRMIEVRDRQNDVTSSFRMRLSMPCLTANHVASDLVRNCKFALAFRPLETDSV